MSPVYLAVYAAYLAHEAVRVEGLALGNEAIEVNAETMRAASERARRLARVADELEGDADG